MTESTVTIEGPTTDVANLCEPILRLVPEWFAMPGAVRRYLREMKTAPTFLAVDGPHVVGFITLKQHFDRSAEVLVMALAPSQHGQGVGRAMVETAAIWLREQGIRFLQVKTLGPSHPDPFYARTRSFYEAVGFVPLEELPTLWGESNPCLMLLMDTADVPFRRDS